MFFMQVARIRRLGLMAPDARRFQVAQRVRGHQLWRAIVGAEHQLPGDLGSRDPETPLHGAQQCVGTGVRVMVLEPGQKLAPRLRLILGKPCPRLVRHRRKRIGSASPSGRRRGAPRRRPGLALLPGMARPLEELLDAGLRVGVGLGEGRRIGEGRQPRLRVANVMKRREAPGPAGTVSGARGSASPAARRPASFPSA